VVDFLEFLVNFRIFTVQKSIITNSILSLASFIESINNSHLLE
jgi:hypothetical protein